MTSLNSQGYSLVEIGDYGRMRTLSFLRPSFEIRGLADPESTVVGVSRRGDQLLNFSRLGNKNFGREVDVTTLGGKVVTSISPVVQGMTVFFAELSPDGNQIAFVGNYAEPATKPSSFGLHLLGVDGTIRTLVATTQAQELKSIGWSSDGMHLVYDSADRISIYDLETGAKRFFAAGNNPHGLRMDLGSLIAVLTERACLSAPTGRVLRIFSIRSTSAEVCDGRLTVGICCTPTLVPAGFGCSILLTVGQHGFSLRSINTMKAGSDGCLHYLSNAPS